MIHQSELEEFQQRSRNNLSYQLVSTDCIAVFNNLNEKVAELTLRYAPVGIYHDAWFGFITGDEFKEIMEGPYITYFIRFGCTKKICNTLGMKGGMDDETAHWFGTTLLPKMVEAGLKYNALVIPEDIFAQQTMGEFEKNMGNNLGRLFPNQEKALEWLMNLN
jgi:hypothetical protein